MGKETLLKMNTKKYVKAGTILIVVGLLICVIGFAVSGFNESNFCENENHVWYQTVRFGDDFMFGIGE